MTGAGANGVFRVPVVRGGAEEALRAEVARRPDHPGRRPEQRHPRQRRVPRAPGRRDGAPRGRAANERRARRRRSACRGRCIRVMPRACAGHLRFGRPCRRDGRDRPAMHGVPWQDARPIAAGLDRRHARRCSATADYVADRSLGDRAVPRAADGPAAVPRRRGRRRQDRDRQGAGRDARPPADPAAMLRRARRRRRGLRVELRRADDRDPARRSGRRASTASGSSTTSSPSAS